MKSRIFQAVCLAMLAVASATATADHRHKPAFEWKTVVNNNDLMPPLEIRNFNSYNQPSVNAAGLVVMRARSRGGPPLGPPTHGIYVRDMADLERCLQEADAAGARFKLITTDGVFSMDGYIARLDEICDLAERYGALVHFDDCHATGFLGKEGRGTHEYRGCMDRVDIITGTLGKALGGASGGFTAARSEIVALLRQRSRPYLFSNTVAPPVVAGAIKAIDLVTESPELRDRLRHNTALFREGLEAQGFELLPGEHPIVPVMIHDAGRAAALADAMLARGVYVVAFSYPVVPQGRARIRTQMSAALTEADIQLALEAFGQARQEVGL